VAWLVGKPRTISTDHITGTGFMKCMRFTRFGPARAAAISYESFDEVFRGARIASACRLAEALKIGVDSLALGAAPITTYAVGQIAVPDASLERGSRSADRAPAAHELAL